MKEFLNAKSMITPGIAGGIITVVSNTCFTQFNIPSKWSALALSFLLALIVVTLTAAALWQKAILWLFNSLIIFSTAVGANQSTAKIAGQISPQPKLAIAPAITTVDPATRLMREKTIADLQTNLRRRPTPGASASPAEAAAANAASIEDRRRLEKMLEDLQNELGPAQMTGAAAPPSKTWLHNWFDE